MRAGVRALVLALAAPGCDYREVDAVLAPVRPGVGPLCEVQHIGPEQQTLLGAGDRSHWLQPWRSWSDTIPARRMREAVGITLSQDDDDPANSRLAALAAAGFARIYTGFNWNEVEYDTPTRIRASVQAGKRDWLMAIRARKLRPHVMVQAHHGLPCVTRTFALRLITPAPAGARQIRVDPAAVSQIVPGRTGLSVPGRTPGVLFTAVTADGTVTLSKPLPDLRAAGMHNAHTLRFPPFQRPLRADGTPNPAFEESMRGWEQFLAATIAVLRPIFADAWDVEIFNEIDHAEFLDANNYYDPPIDHGPGLPYDIVGRAVLARSLAFFRNPAHGVTGVRVVSGISNSRFQDVASNLPGGIELSRHLALHGASYPASAENDTGRALRSDGGLNGGPGPDGRWREAFTPTYVAVFPEQALVALLHPRVLFPDLSPHPTVDRAGNARGRTIQAEGGPSPAVFVSSFNLSPPRRFFDLGSANSWNAQAELWRFKTKSALRAISSYVGRGVESFVFYQGSELSDLVDDDDPTGGPVVQAIGRFMTSFRGPEQAGTPRSITLESVTGCATGTQFEGNGTRQFPPLWNSEVVAFFPFQLDEGRFVASAYLMTRDLGKVRRPAAPATDVTRHDLPREMLTLTIRGLGSPLRVEWFDPLTSDSGVLTPEALGDGRVRLTVPLTDSPRLLTFADR